jgi:hypothetical protein
MARPNPQQAVAQHKEFWDHFKGFEMECFAAYVYKFDCIWPRRKQSVDQDKQVLQYKEMELPEFRQDAHHTLRPWTCYERLKRAVVAFARKMEDNPAMNVNFKIAYLEPDDTITSGTYLLEPAEIEKSKQIFYAIVGKNGTEWGDEAMLKEIAEGPAGEVCKKYGFKEANYSGKTYPPFVAEVGELENLSDPADYAKKKKAEDSFVPKEQMRDDSEAQEAPRRGRPPKAKVEA